MGLRYLELSSDALTRSRVEQRKYFTTLSIETCTSTSSQFRAISNLERKYSIMY